MQSQLRQITNIINHTTDQLLFEAVEQLRDSVLPITPKKTGNLRNSAITEKVGANEYQLSFVAPYAIKVHEIQAQNYTTPGTGHRYLARGVEENKDKIAQVFHNNMTTELNKHLARIGLRSV